VIAALYVMTGGVYFGVPDVDPWDARRDARTYAGPWPVVAHPPCARWCRLSKLVEHRENKRVAARPLLPGFGHGRAVGEDGGTFAAALASVRTWGGVLEHPASSYAWAAHGLQRPPREGWARAADGGWVCEVSQAAYGHRAGQGRAVAHAHRLSRSAPVNGASVAPHGGRMTPAPCPQCHVEAQHVADHAAEIARLRDVNAELRAERNRRVRASLGAAAAGRHRRERRRGAGGAGTMIRIGSLFSGIGGLELGIEAALAEAGIPHRVVFQVEIDPFCRAVLAKHWPDADRSVTDVRAASSLPHVDIICGGFPCQDVSSAGKGAGLDGERSGLWFVYRDVVAALCPRVVLVENVASGKRRYLCRVRSDLHALGYRTTAYQLGAHDVDAPHRRERVFVVAVANTGGFGRERGADTGAGRCREGEAGSEGLPGFLATARGGAMADANSDRCEGERVCGLLDGERSPCGHNADGRGGAEVGDAERARREGAEHARREAERGVGGEPHGLPAGMDRRIPARWPAGRGEAQHDWEAPRTVQERQPGRRQRLKALGNAVVPAQAREVARVAVVPLLGGAS
jgi:DNA (cytosine-5)-methyltransferase 1